MQCAALLLALLCAGAARAQTQVPATDTRIKYLGAWRTWGSSRYTIYPGSTLRVRLQGTARLRLEKDTTDPPRFRVRRLGRDGGAVYNVNNTVNLTAIAAPAEFEIVYMAMQGTAFTPASVAYTGSRLRFEGLELAEGATLLEATEPLGRVRLGFLGDSITHGVRILRDSGDNLNSQDASQCYGYFLARALHAQYRVRGHSGESTGTLHEKVAWFSRGVALEPAPDPDYLFINIGANDTRDPDWLYQSNLQRVLARVRTTFPASFIYVLDFFRDDPDRTAAIINAIANSAAGHATYFHAHRYIAGLPDGIHPKADSHAALAAALARRIGPAATLAAPPTDAVVSNRPHLVWWPVPEAETYFLWLARNGEKYHTTDVGAATNWPAAFDLPSGDYTWWVQARNRYARLKWSTPRTFTILPYKPDPPVALGPTGRVDIVRRPLFTWLTAPRATWHRVWIKRNGETYSRFWVRAGTSWTPGEDLPGGDYTWWVRGWNADGYGPWSEPATFTIPVVVPGPVLLDEPRGTITNSPPVYRWQADPAATWYRLRVWRYGRLWYRKWYYTAPTNGWIERAVGEHPFGRYTWWVRGWTPDGYGPWSEPQSFVYGHVEGLAPTGVVSDTRQPVFHWTDVPEAQDYRLLLYRNGGFFHRQVVEGATQWPSSLQLPYGRYRWWVRGRKHDGVGPWSEPKVFFIGRCTPVSPAGDLATPPDTLTWQAGPAVAAAWYELRIDFDGWLFWRRWVRATDVAVAGDERSYPLPTEAQPLPPGPLTWRVRTWNRSDGYGPWSERLAFSVPAPAP